MSRNKPTLREWPAVDVFVAAVVASRVNGGQYIKPGAMLPAPTEDEPFRMVPHPLTANRVLMDATLTGQADAPVVTDQDRADGQEMRTHFQGLYFKVLGGKILSDYESAVMSLANAEMITERELNWIASLPSAWNRDRSRATVQERIDRAAKKYAGSVGSKIGATAEIVRCVYSRTWNTHYATAISTDNTVLFFAVKSPVAEGTTVRLEGKIKAHRDNFQTQLNYVKIL